MNEGEIPNIAYHICLLYDWLVMFMQISLGEYMIVIGGESRNKVGLQ